MTGVAGRAGMLELRTRISRAGLDGREYRVIRPDRPASRLVMLDQSAWLAGYADRDAVKQLATLWSLAAASPRSIVYLPMRRNTSAYEGRSLDLVLSYASLQLRPSRWKALRARLGDGASHTVQIPDPGIDESELDYTRVYYREYRDTLAFDHASDTLFITGGRESFHRTAVHIRSMLSETIGHKHSDHLCVELVSGNWLHPRTRHNTSGLLHFQYEPHGWPSPR
jgi:hypothetical protein